MCPVTLSNQGVTAATKMGQRVLRQIAWEPRDCVTPGTSMETTMSFPVTGDSCRVGSRRRTMRRGDPLGSFARGTAASATKALPVPWKGGYGVLLVKTEAELPKVANRTQFAYVLNGSGRIEQHRLQAGGFLIRYEGDSHGAGGRCPGSRSRFCSSDPDAPISSKAERGRGHEPLRRSRGGRGNGWRR